MTYSAASDEGNLRNICQLLRKGLRPDSQGSLLGPDHQLTKCHWIFKINYATTSISKVRVDHYIRYRYEEIFSDVPPVVRSSINNFRARNLKIIVCVSRSLRKWFKCCDFLWVYSAVELLTFFQITFLFCFEGEQFFVLRF